MGGLYMHACAGQHDHHMQHHAYGNNFTEL